MTIATWNINGMQARLGFVRHWLAARGPDLALLQELKVPDDRFPHDELREAGTVYEEVNLALNPDQWPKVEELTGGERITPVTVQDGEVEVGFHGVG